MPIFPFLSFLLFGNGKEDEEKKEGKALLFSDFFHLKRKSRGRKKKRARVFTPALSINARLLFSLLFRFLSRNREKGYVGK